MSMLSNNFLFSLTPGKMYFYIFGDVYGWSKEFNFVAAPKPGPGVTTRVVAYGGEGGREGGRE